MRSAPATARNREPILAQLRLHFADRHDVLEIGSGTGEHAVFFSAALPHLTWHSSDVRAHHADIGAHQQASPSPNCPPPLAYELGVDGWPAGPFDAVFSANTCHIMAWQHVVAMFSAFGAHLPAGAVVCIYGPFNYGGQFTSDSNAAFDRDLRARSADMGIRDFEAIDALARAAGLILQEDVAMPANNRLLVWRKQ